MILSRLCERGMKDAWHENDGNIEEVAQKFIKTYSTDNREVELQDFCYLGTPELGIKPLKVFRQKLTNTLYVELRAI